MTPALAEAIIGAIGFIGVVGLIVWYLMSMDTPEHSEHEFDSARRKMTRPMD